IAGRDFNGVQLFDGATLNVTTDGEGGTFAMTAVDMGAGAYATATGSTVDTIANAGTALTNIKAAIDQLAGDRAHIGANISRLTSTGEQLGVLGDNLTAAVSRIQDVDVAEESTS